MYHYQDLREQLDDKIDNDLTHLLSLLKEVKGFTELEQTKQIILRQELNASMLSIMTSMTNIVENDINKTNNTYYDSLEDNNEYCDEEISEYNKTV